MQKLFGYQGAALFFFCMAFFAFSCSNNRAVINNATIDAVKPPSIYGNATELKQHHISHGISMEYGAGPSNAIIPLPGQVKVGEEIQAEKSSINYRLIDNILGFQYFSVAKSESNFYFGGGFGYHRFPYIFATLGANREYFEIGAAILYGSSHEKISYDGYYVDKDDVWQSDFNEEKRNCSSYSSGYLYTSFYYKRIALNYAVSASKPISNDIYENCSHFLERAIFSFDFPLLLMQDLGIAYTNNHVRYRIGLNQISSENFPKRHYRVVAHAAWFF